MKTPFKTKVVHISANELTKAMIASDIKQAKKDGYRTLAYEWESLLGPYLTIDLDDFDEEGQEKEEEGGCICLEDNKLTQALCSVHHPQVPKPEETG